MDRGVYGSMSPLVIQTMISATRSQIAALDQVLQVLEHELQKAQAAEQAPDQNLCPGCSGPLDDLNFKGILVCPKCNWRNKEL